MPFRGVRKFRPWWRDAEEKVVRNGFRIAVFGEKSTKEKFTGEYKNDMKHGKGIQTYEDGTVYEGDFRFERRSGHGVLSRDCGHGIRSRIYSGQWENDQPCGIGLKNFPDGSIYKGEFKKGKRHGYGCMYYSDGSIYIGKWFKDIRENVGRLIQSGSENFYEGSFKNNQKCGRGRYYHLLTGQIQEGVWYDDKAQVTWMWDDPKRRPVAKKKTLYAIPELHLNNPHEIFHEAALEVMKLVKSSE